MKPLSMMVWAMLLAVNIQAQEALTPLPDDPYFQDFKPIVAPKTQEALLRAGDRLAICGDSITEQKMYSRIMETYLTVCEPELGLEVRQYGWSGEQAPGFLARMSNDVLRFNPTIVTTCYGMNDHRYVPYQEELGERYRRTNEAIIRLFQARGVRVVHGSPGTVGKMPSWVQEAQGTVRDLNLSLLEFRNIGVRLAENEQTAFADVFVPMLVAGYRAQKDYAPDYMVPGKDGVHPGWSGHLIMAYAFLKGLGVDGEIGTIRVNLATDHVEASEGHEVKASAHGRVELVSRRYPFCAEGEPDTDSSLRSGMTLVPFNEELNRLTLIVTGAKAKAYRVTWGEASQTYSAEALHKGVNLAADFAVNPFSSAFKRVDEAVARKQAYETKQIKQLFHGEEGRADMDMTVALSEKTRAGLVANVRNAFQPVHHTIVIEAAE